ncbi:MAG: Holliday junction branch migration protein RuvA [Spirochaetaceae bacterium]|nr:MAG: Holliday junction branch migration protein RuvA [Spirochaetaceae bacterium]
MFNSLTGKLAGHSYPRLFLATGGVEWELEVSAATFQAVLAENRDAPQRLLVHLQVREDLMKLFGFGTEAERQVFQELITVSGIGPRQALRILSGTTVRELTRLLEAEDVQALTRIPGLGTKTAQKMILQLKGHLVLEDSAGGRSAGGTGPLEELLAALVEMGFDRAAARTVLERLREENQPSDALSPLGETEEREIFRRAIQELSR